MKTLSEEFNGVVERFLIGLSSALQGDVSLEEAQKMLVESLIKRVKERDQALIGEDLPTYDYEGGVIEYAKIANEIKATLRKAAKETL